MQILFLGQLGIAPAFGDTMSREARAAVLGQLLSEQGHTVTIVATSAFSATHTKKWGLVRLVHWPSFHPQKPGGWLYEVLSLVTLWKLQPEVVHICSFKAAILSRLGAVLSPQTTFVWTVDCLPSDQPWLTRWGLRLAGGVMDAITCPTRTIQYRLLTEFGIKARYIPDGYMPMALPALAVSRWGLRKGQYVITCVASAASLGRLAKAYRQTGSRKKLVAIVPEVTAAYKRLAKRYKFLVLVPNPSPRVKNSLIYQAAVAVAVDAGPLDFLLQAMQSALAVVAGNHSLNQEIVGTTGRFVERGDTDGLVKALSALLSSPTERQSLGQAAQKRARAHFLWRRIVEEYMTVYHYPAVRKVPVDSIFGILKPAADLSAKA